MKNIFNLLTNAERSLFKQSLSKETFFYNEVMKMNTYNKFLTISIILCCSGCSSFGIDGHIQNSRTLAAEERMLLVTEKGLRKNIDGSVTRNTRVVCAEPSPDAIMALAASGTLSGIFGSGEEVQGQAAFSQAVGELGERTPVIQLLRDSLYRSCEAYMNGLLNEEDYTDILAFFDIYSATLLGMESLTHTQKPPVIVQTSASSELTKSTENAEGKLESHGVSPTVPALITAQDKSEQVAEKVSNILKEYHKSKGILFYFLEAKKLNRKGLLSTQDYLDRMRVALSITQ